MGQLKCPLLRIGYGDAADYTTKYVMQNPTALADAFSVGANTADSTPIDTLKAKNSGESGVKVNRHHLPFHGRVSRYFLQ